MVLVFIIIVFFFFFFKQKTAYEMRISDWSSDVCSSDLVKSHPFVELLEKPNPLMTGKQLKREFLGYERITGNSYMYAATPGIGLNATLPQELWIIPSPCVEIVTGTRRDPRSGYKVAYFSDDNIPKEKIAHMKSFNPVADVTGSAWLYGMAPLKAGRASLGQFQASETAQGTLFKNMGPIGILSGDSDKTVTEAQGVMIQDKFVQKHTGLIDGGGIVITTARVKDR